MSDFTPSLIPKAIQDALAVPSLKNIGNLNKNASQTIHSYTIRDRPQQKYPCLLQASNTESLTSEEVLSKYSASISDLEKTEIPRYKNLYFIGNEKKKLLNDYTSPEGNYIVNEGDHIAYRYEIIKLIDSGSFGQVIFCVDHKNRQEVAVKVLKKTNNSAKQALNEFKISNTLGNSEAGHHSIVKIKRRFEYRFHSFLVFELLSINLYEFFKKNEFRPMSPGLVKRITIQLLTGLNHIHSNKIIHCDLKPENILFKHANKSSIRIIDFGNSCYFDQKLFTYIQSRLYRAPEIILQCGYNEAIDMWSLGCIVAEMLLGNPIFAGNNEKEMLKSIVNVLGPPPDSVVTKAKAVFLLERIKNDSQNFPLHRIFKEYGPDIIQFLTDTLKWKAEERLTAKEALNSQWIKGIHIR